MSFPNVSDIVSTTLEKRSTTIQDNVTKNNAILYQLGRKGKIKPQDGGRLLYEVISFAENTNGGWYSGYDPLPVAAQDVITAAEFNWKQYAVPVTISGLEEMQNSGESALLDLIDARLDVAEGTMANDISDGLYSDGAGSSGKELTGLDAAVPQANTTGTYGGINRATAGNEFWRSQLYDPGTTGTASTIQQHMTLLWSYCVRGNDKPDLIMAGSTVWSVFMASLQTNQRFTDAEMANAGFDNVKFMSAPVVLDGGIGGFATATDMYFLNTKFLTFKPHAKRNMVPIGKRRVAVNQDAAVEILGFMGNLTSSGPQFCGRYKND